MTTSLLFLIVVVGIAYDLSRDLVRAGQLARDLQAEKERLSLAAEGADLGVWEWDMDHDTIWATETFRTFFGLSETEELSLDRFLRALHPDDRRTVQAGLEREIEAGHEFRYEYRVIGANGEVRWFASRGRVERRGNGRPFMVRGVTLDITGRKKADENAERQRADLAHVQRASAVGELASTLAHELHQPLGAILRNAEAAELFLLQDQPDLEELKAIMSDIISDDRRAGEVIERMRSLLKNREPHYESLEIEPMLKQIVTLVEPEIRFRGVELNLDCPAGLPPARGDRVQIQQVILNLLLNGLDAVEGLPTARRRLVIAVVPSGVDELEFAVSDAGIGIRPGEESRIFEPFSSTKPTGLGMGLAISKAIIDAHGGRILAENNPEAGTTFRFSLKQATSS